ncbi:MAG: hypothetical protein ETSY2_43465 [Candidatus Entotheonella gemina]|uniref:Uncharacterized protein n=1 Tax=Candidatus Entotheonella gemina TaxID=1429439 RepID=W4LJD6_9BACT|nr:MAG: hypothetical protein ETSY2_43465 [Candidatus Entotheonella gemina]
MLAEPFGKSTHYHAIGKDKYDSSYGTWNPIPLREMCDPLEESGKDTIANALGDIGSSFVLTPNTILSTLLLFDHVLTKHINVVCDVRTRPFFQ